MIKRTIKYFILSMFFIVLYIYVSILWVEIGAGIKKFPFIEGLIILSILYILYFDKIKSAYYKYLLPIIPILTIYFAFDIFYIFLERSPRPSDLQNFPSVFEFSLILGMGGLATILCFLIPIILLIQHATKYYTTKNLSILVSCKILAILFIIYIFSTDRFIYYHEKIYNYIDWSHALTIRRNGRINSFIYYYGMENKNKNILLNHNSRKFNNINVLYPGNPSHTPNIHLIILESFIDPRLLKDIKFNRSPLADNLHQYLNKRAFSLVVSPVYGGETAQAEFELLTGIKAYAKIGASEFNIMNGGKVNGFIKKLTDYGYRVIGTIATGSGYYNSKQAYKSLGIIEPNFLGNHKISQNFDGDLLDNNIEKIKNMMLTSNAPIFNYVLGMYGHYPFPRNIHLRPDLIYTSHHDNNISKLSNQFYYRTLAIYEYIKTLNEIDPGCIIYITSDHLPPILGDEINYSIDKHINIALFFHSGEYIDVSGKFYYEIPWFMWDILTGKEFNRTLNGEMENLYYNLLYESL